MYMDRREIIKAPGSENPARQDFGTPQDAEPGSFSTIKSGNLPCSFEKNSCAARMEGSELGELVVHTFRGYFVGIYPKI